MTHKATGVVTSVRVFPQLGQLAGHGQCWRGGYEVGHAAHQQGQSRLDSDSRSAGSGSAVWKQVDHWNGGNSSARFRLT